MSFDKQVGRRVEDQTKRALDRAAQQMERSLQRAAERVERAEQRAAEAGERAERAVERARERVSKADFAREHGLQVLDDALQMRALAHPLRLQMIELLLREGSLTATEIADLVGESPANCSWHLRQLARYGHVEEAEGGTGRRRPWRLVSSGRSWSIVDQEGETRVAAGELAALKVRRDFDLAIRWVRTMSDYPDGWVDAASMSDALLYLTEDELHALSREMAELMLRYVDRTAERSKRPEGSRPVQVLGYTFPLPPTPSGA